MSDFKQWVTEKWIRGDGEVTWMTTNIYGNEVAWHPIYPTEEEATRTMNALNALRWSEDDYLDNSREFAVAVNRGLLSDYVIEHTTPLPNPTERWKGVFCAVARHKAIEVQHKVTGDEYTKCARCGKWGVQTRTCLRNL